MRPGQVSSAVPAYSMVRQNRQFSNEPPPSARKEVCVAHGLATWLPADCFGIGYRGSLALMRQINTARPSLALISTEL